MRDRFSGGVCAVLLFGTVSLTGCANAPVSAPATSPAATQSAANSIADSPQPDPSQVVEDFKPASTNQPGKKYPQVNSQGRARLRVVAVGASRVRSDLGGGMSLVKSEDGTWVGTSRPLDEGFHYYTINVDGAQVSDPGSMPYYGAGRDGSAIEIPAKDEDFYALKDVPHGQLRENLYFSKISNAWRRCYVYTPPGYDADVSARFPVLYLQHGAWEDETGWGNQGHANLILDNLIAAGKAKPMIIVMDNGGGPVAGDGAPGRPAANPPPMIMGAPASTPASAPSAGPPGRRGGPRFDFSQFEKILTTEIIPMIDANYRTLADQPHRAMAGLSMGGMQTRAITLAHLDLFSHIGVFSGGSIGADTPALSDPAVFKQKVKVLFVSYGSRERTTQAKADHAALENLGIPNTYYESPNTAHEWLTWRRSLYQYAPLLFRD